MRSGMVMFVVAMPVVMLRRKCRGGKHHQKQG